MKEPRCDSTQQVQWLRCAQEHAGHMRRGGQQGGIVAVVSGG